MPGANWYRDGTVTATNGSKAVLGSGTIWSVQAKTGDLFALLSDGGVVKFYEIDAVTDNTHLTLKDEFAETTAEAAEYAIVRNFNTTMTSETNAQLVSFLREWKLALQNNLKGDQGDPGEDGNTIYSNNGAPAAGLGVDDDWCIDYSTWNMYRKESGTWTLRGNIKGETGAAGAPGAKWYSSASDPSSAIGVTGDYALNTTSGDVFKRWAGGWTLEGNLMGPTGATGAQGPQGATGATGATGTAGSRWHTVTGVPSTALGVNTDMALDTATGNWYQKESGAWGLKGNIKGPTGATGAQGIPGATWKGEWSSATEYVARDVVYYNGNSYIALQTGTNQTPPATSDSYWQIIARKGTDGEGAGDMTKEDYDSDADGKVNAAVAADTATYATTAGSATIADTASSVAWGDVTNKPTDFTPSAHSLDAHTAVTLAELNAKVSDATIPSNAAATTSAAGLMSAADKTKLDGLGSGGGSVMLTLFHTTEAQSTTEETYTALYTGNFIPRFDWHGDVLYVLVRHSGTGQIRATVTDGTDTVTDEGTAFSAEGTDELSIDVSTLDDSVLWAFTVEGKGTDCNASRVKVTADPVDEFSPPLVASGAGGTTNSAAYTELASSTFLPTWLDVDGNGGVVLLADVSLGTATGADVRITIGTESATVAVSADGITSVRCPYPATAAAMLTARIDGRITAGSGTMSLNHYQIHIEK